MTPEPNQIFLDRLLEYLKNFTEMSALVATNSLTMAEMMVQMKALNAEMQVLDNTLHRNGYNSRIESVETWQKEADKRREKRRSVVLHLLSGIAIGTILLVITWLFQRVIRP